MLQSAGVLEGTIFEVGLLLLPVGVLEGTIFEVGLLLLSGFFLQT